MYQSLSSGQLLSCWTWSHTSTKVLLRNCKGVNSVIRLSCVPQTSPTQRKDPGSPWPSFRASTHAERPRSRREKSRGSTEALRVQRASTRGRCPCRPRSHWASSCPAATSAGDRWSTPAGCLLLPTALSRCLPGAEDTVTEPIGVFSASHTSSTSELWQDPWLSKGTNGGFLKPGGNELLCLECLSLNSMYLWYLILKMVYQNTSWGRMGIFSFLLIKVSPMPRTGLCTERVLSKY